MLSSSVGLVVFLGGATTAIGGLVRLLKAKYPTMPVWAPLAIAAALGWLATFVDQALGVWLAPATTLATSYPQAAWIALWGLFTGPGAAGLHELAKHILDPLIGRDARIKLLGRLEKQAGTEAKKITKPDVKPALLVLAILLGCVGCSPTLTKVQIVAAETMAEEVNARAETMATDWANEGDAILEGAESYDQAKADLEAHELAYRKKWRALDLVAALHDVWATALERGEADLALFGRVLRAYCAASELVELPAIAAAPCPKE